jgi:hypothetical protein
MKNAFWRAVLEMGFIVFALYSVLLMREFTYSGKGREIGLVWAIEDILTPANFTIAIFAALVGYILFEFLRNKG